MAEQQGIRKLAAIMFSDMVGYTALMQDNETIATDKKNHFRASVQKNVSGHGGTVLQFYGDGILSMFDSPYEAVVAAVKIQSELRSKEIPLRIGIHTGDIVYDGEGAFGDGVNVASRIESLAVPGSVLVSDKVYDDLKNQSDILCKSVGIYEFKNVKRPTEVYAILNNDLVLPDKKEMKGKVVETSNTIAVLPFVNMSNDIENEYFSDGITEEIINALVKIPDMMVTSRTSSFKFKGQNDDVREIGEQLGVAKVLEGSVRKAGNKVRITAQLINTKDGYHVWSKVYDRELSDVFAVQDEISQQISAQLITTFNTNNTSNSPANKRTKNPEAFNLYLKGIFHFKKNTPQDNKLALKYLEDAVALDNEFALAYSALAFTYSILSGFGQIKPTEGYPKAEAASKKALQLDDESAEAWCSMGLICMMNYWDMEGAGKAFDRALEINPNDFEVLHAASFYYYVVGDHNKNLENMKRAYLMDPLSVRTNKGLGDAYLACKMYDRAQEQYDKVLEIDPSYRAANESKGRAYLEQENYEEALKSYTEYRNQIGDPLKGNPPMVFTYARLGMMDEAQKYMDLLKQRVERDKDVDLDIDLSMAYLGLGDIDKALDMLGKSMEQKSSGILYMHNSPMFKEFWTHPRYIKLISDHGLDKLLKNHPNR